jgi:hypothetical protein
MAHDVAGAGPEEGCDAGRTSLLRSIMGGRQFPSRRSGSVFLGGERLSTPNGSRVEWEYIWCMYIDAWHTYVTIYHPSCQLTRNQIVRGRKSETGSLDVHSGPGGSQRAGDTEG